MSREEKIAVSIIGFLFLTLAVLGGLIVTANQHTCKRYFPEASTFDCVMSDKYIVQTQAHP